jgi:hypothetical protein
LQQCNTLLHCLYVADLTLLLDTDNAWTWRQMATADVFVMSASQFSYVPGVLNTQGLVLAPYNSIFWLRHWFKAADAAGVLPEAFVAELDRRLGLRLAGDIGSSSRNSSSIGSSIGSSTWSYSREQK